MLTPASDQQGVSLVEVMIGLAVLGILMALAAPSFSSYIQNTHIRNAAEGIQNGLNLARAEAVRRNTSVQFRLGTDFSWAVGCETEVGDTDGDGVADCPGTIFSKSAAEGSSKASVVTSEVVAASGIAVTNPSFTGTLAFNGLGKEHTLSSPANMARFDITNPNAGECQAVDRSGLRCLRVTVTPGGQVRMCDPMLGGSAQGC